MRYKHDTNIGSSVSKPVIKDPRSYASVKAPILTIYLYTQVTCTVLRIVSIGAGTPTRMNLKTYTLQHPKTSRRTCIYSETVMYDQG
jgi:hypothetical protein